MDVRLATIHSPWLAGAGILIGAIAAFAYTRWQHVPVRATMDALAAPLTLGLAIEQFGALLAGAGYGTDNTVRWAVVYTNALAQRWSGTPLGIPLHPVQAYAALAYAAVAMFLLVWMPMRRQTGDIAGAAPHRHRGYRFISPNFGAIPKGAVSCSTARSMCRRWPRLCWCCWEPGCSAKEESTLPQEIVPEETVNG